MSRPKTFRRTGMNSNLEYCLAFLRNGGERLRAVGLCMHCTGWDLKTCMEFVDKLKKRAPLTSNREWEKVCDACNVTLDIRTPYCPICQRKKLRKRKKGLTLMEVFAKETEKTPGKWTPAGQKRPWDYLEG